MKLSEMSEQWIPRGSILRVHSIEKRTSRYQKIKKFDLLLFKPEGNLTYGIVNFSGHKAGLIRVILPAESTATDRSGLNKDWLILNWEKWVDDKSNPKNVVIGIPEK